jgi:Ethanolamine utilization protein EutJ (predicted chaperonin)
MTPEPEIGAPPVDPVVEDDAEETPLEAISGWARAIRDGLKETAQEALEAGRRGAHEAYDEYWRRFDRKTKMRRG